MKKIAWITLGTIGLMVFPLQAGDDEKPEPEYELQVLDEAASFEHKDALMAAITEYWEMVEYNNYVELYERFLPAFKEDVSLNDYLQKKRSRVDDYRIHRLRFWGDTCAQVEFRLSIQAESMELNNVPMRQVWKWVDGEWFVYENPNTISMLPRSLRRKKSEKPCPLPAEWQRTKPKANTKID